MLIYQQWNGHYEIRASECSVGGQRGHLTSEGVVLLGELVLCLLQRNILTQEYLNWALLHCWWLSFQFSSVAQSCPTLCDPMDCSMPGFPVQQQLPEHIQTHVHRVSDAIQQSHPLSSPSPPALNLSQQQGLFQGVNSSHQVAKVLEFQLQHQSFQ